MNARAELDAARSITTGYDRYPGALPFGDTPLDRLRFFGREDETQAVLHQLLSVDLLVFFGRSGLGKSSLVNAALLPLLRSRDFLPVPVRFGESEPPLRIVLNAVAEACDREGIDWPTGNENSLWEFFKTAIFWRDDRVQIPLLLLDQFEEVFTLQSEEFRRALAVELGEVTATRAPKDIRPRLAEYEDGHGNATHGSPTPLTGRPPKIKILISLREDYLGALQELAPAIPGILLNRFRLTGLSEEEARNAVTKPALIVTEELRFATEPFTYRGDTLAQMIAAARDAEQGSVEPFVLQLLCSHVEKQIRSKQTVTATGLEVDTSYLGGEKGIRAVTANFYFDALKRLPQRSLRRRARALCETGLLTGSGRRRTMLQDDLRERFKLPPEAFETLEGARLLRKEARHDSFYYEISHDRLAEAIHETRRWRIPREVKATLAVVLLLIGSAGLVLFFKAQTEATARRAAELQRQDAEGVMNYLVTDLRDTLMALGRVDLLDEVQKKVDAYYERLGGSAESGAILRRTAVSYRNRGDVLLNRGNLDAATRSYQAFSELITKLVARDPANPLWQRDLSVSYSRISEVQRARGDMAAALSSQLKSLAIVEKLAARDTANTEWQGELELSYRSLGDVQSARSDLAAALSSYNNSLAIVEKLAARDTANTEWQRSLGASYSRIGDVQLLRGNLATALGSFERTLTITEKLAALDAANPEWQSNLAASHERIGDVQRARSELSAALSSYHKALAIMREVAAGDPANTHWQGNLAASYSKVGDAQHARGDLSAALRSYQKTLAINEKLAARDTTNRDWQRFLAESYAKIGDLRRERGDLTAATSLFYKSLAIVRNLAARDPANSEWQNDLASIHDRLGDVQSARGNLAAALSSSLKSLAIAEKLAARDPANLLWQGNLATGYTRIGDVQRARKEMAAALSSYRTSLAITEKFASRDSTNTAWQHGLSVIYQRIGDVQSVWGDETTALSSHRKSLAIAERLAAGDSTSLQWRIHLVVELWRVASLLEQQGAPEIREAAANYHRALEILRVLASKNRLTAQQKSWILQLEPLFEATK